MSRDVWAFGKAALTTTAAGGSDRKCQGSEQEKPDAGRQRVDGNDRVRSGSGGSEGDRCLRLPGTRWCERGDSNPAALPSSATWLCRARALAALLARAIRPIIAM